MNITLSNPSFAFQKAKNTIIPFGKYKGQKLGDLPYSYLKWGSENLSNNEIKRKMQVLTNPVMRRLQHKNIF